MIKIDFNIAYRQAQEMSNCADEMYRQREKLNSVLAEVRNAWRGRVSQMYVQKMESFGDRLEKEVAQCRADAVEFRARIDELKRMEEEAARAMEAALNKRSGK